MTWRLVDARVDRRDTISHPQEAPVVQRVVAGLVAVALVPVLAITGHAQPRMKLGEVLVLEPVDAEPGLVPGAPRHLFKADRGSRKGQQVRVSIPPGTRPSAPAGGPDQRWSEYHLLSPHTVGALPDVDVLGIHYTKVRPDRRDAFERFVADKVHPAVANLRPDLGVLYYKAVTGPDAGNYIALFALTKESRDKYWPGGSDSDALRAAFSPAVRGLTRELSTYLVEGSYAADDKLAAAVYESREWTDFVLVSPVR